MSEWNLDWFRRFDAPVSLSIERTHIARSKETTIAQYVDSIATGTDGGHYMDQFSFDRLPVLYEYVRHVYPPSDRRYDLNLWIGPSDTDISFHKDNPDKFQLVSNLFVQISGRKRVLLVSPDQDDCMYPRSFEEGAYWHSRVDHNQPDFERFPRFKEAKILEAVLEPGEMLFIPGDYWHSVRSLDKSISVSCWWRTHRLVALAVEGITAVAEGRPFVPIRLADIEEFGGVQKLKLAMDGLEPAIKDGFLKLCEPRALEEVQRTLSGA